MLSRPVQSRCSGPEAVSLGNAASKETVEGLEQVMMLQDQAGEGRARSLVFDGVGCSRILHREMM